ncbi:MAG: hypothetical protein HC767_11585 [Akkermansiaceae bacterium]|nr:hypothetical protein [Akkermansiaceae bacterium]
MSEPIIDQPPQAVFGYAHLFRQRSDGQSFAPPSLALSHHLFKSGERVLIACIHDRLDAGSSWHMNFCDHLYLYLITIFRLNFIDLHEIHVIQAASGQES